MEGDQRIRTQRGDLPEDEHQQQAAGQHQSDHGADEEQHKGVIAAELGFAVHVIDREDDRQAADHRGNGRQEHAQAIGAKVKSPKTPPTGRRSTGSRWQEIQQRRCQACRDGKDHRQAVLQRAGGGRQPARPAAPPPREPAMVRIKDWLPWLTSARWRAL